MMEKKLNSVLENKVFTCEVLDVKDRLRSEFFQNKIICYNIFVDPNYPADQRELIQIQ